MDLVLRSLTLRIIWVGGFCLGLAGLVPFALGQTNLDADIPQAATLHDLSPLAGIVRLAFWFLAAALLIVAAVMFGLRQRATAGLYKTASDAQWDDDSREDAGERVDASDVDEACAVLDKAGGPDETAKPAVKTESRPQGRLFTPASGVAWGEPMLRAFLGTCMKVNCLGRTWRESAARRSQSSKLPDPREAELVRRLMQRWPEFHVDPETGVFLERSSAAGKSRVCVISVIKDKRTLVEASFNAGFVIESVGRYLKNTDLVHQRGLGEYHAPTKDELTAMLPGERDSMMRITDIPDPWQAMIGGSRGAVVGLPRDAQEYAQLGPE
jgi:hypothetical protein